MVSVNMPKGCIKDFVCGLHMASVNCLLWEDQYPVFFKEAITEPLGAIEHIDEFGTPFWSKTTFVLLKPSHPLIMAPRRSEHDAIGEIHRIFDEEKTAAMSEEARQLNARVPVKISKDTYTAAKLIFLAERNSTPFLETE